MGGLYTRLLVPKGIRGLEICFDIFGFWTLEWQLVLVYELLDAGVCVCMYACVRVRTERLRLLRSECGALIYSSNML